MGLFFLNQTSYIRGMSSDPFAYALEDLPDQLPLFPLAGAVLLPGGRLPLNVFEPRYLNMVEAALAAKRLIGMIQPQAPKESTIEDSLDQDQQEDDAEIALGSDASKIAPKKDLYQTGCAGRIVQFEETDDGRLQIVLEGVCRFHKQAVQETKGGFLLAQVDWQPFAKDMEPNLAIRADREAFLATLKEYFTVHSMQADWQLIQLVPLDKLTVSLAMICPFTDTEKQAILEAEYPQQRFEMMATLMEMALHQLRESSDTPLMN